MVARGGSKWVCAMCTLENPARKRKCGVCENPRPAEGATPAASTPSNDHPSGSCIPTKSSVPDAPGPVSPLRAVANGRRTKKAKTCEAANDDNTQSQKPAKAPSRHKIRTSRKAPVIAKWLKSQKRKRSEAVSESPPISREIRMKLCVGDEDDEMLQQPLIVIMNDPNGIQCHSSSTDETTAVANAPSPTITLDQISGGAVASPPTTPPINSENSDPITTTNATTSLRDKMEQQNDECAPRTDDDGDQHDTKLPNHTHATGSNATQLDHCNPQPANEANKHEEGVETGNAEANESAAAEIKNATNSLNLGMVIAAAASPAAFGSSAGAGSEYESTSLGPQEEESKTTNESGADAIKFTAKQPWRPNSRTSFPRNLESESSQQPPGRGKANDCLALESSVDRSEEPLVAGTSATAQSALVVPVTKPTINASNISSRTPTDGYDKATPPSPSKRNIDNSHNDVQGSSADCPNASNSDSGLSDPTEHSDTLEKGPPTEKSDGEPELTLHRTDEESDVLSSLPLAGQSNKESQVLVPSGQGAVESTKMELGRGQLTSNKIDGTQQQHGSILQGEGIACSHSHRQKNSGHAHDERKQSHESGIVTAMAELDKNYFDEPGDHFGFVYTPPSQMSQEYEYPATAPTPSDSPNTTPQNGTSPTMPAASASTAQNKASDEVPHTNNNHRRMNAPKSKAATLPPTRPIPTAMLPQAPVPTADKEKPLASNPTPISAKAPLVAFQTAGRGTRVVASEEGLKKAEQLLFGKSDSTVSAQAPIAVPFQTSGRGAKVVASEEGHKKAEQLWAGQSDTAGSQAPMVVAFQTAGRGTKVVASDEGMKKAEELLVAKSYTDAPLTVAFQTAGRGTRVVASEEGIKKAEQLLVQKSDTAAPLAVAFQTTGRGTKVVASEEGMKKAEQLFARQTKTTGSQAPMAVAFQTAGRGTRVVASEEGLKNAEQLWAGQSDTAGSTQAPVAVAFQTAGRGQKVVASEEGMKKAQQLLVAKSGSAGSTQAPVAVALQTAGSGQKVVASEEGMKKAEQLLVAKSDSAGSTQAPFAVAFQTAGRGQQVVASEEEIKKVEQLLVAQYDTAGSEGGPMAVAFQTAGNGTKVVASEEGMKNVEKLWHIEPGPNSANHPDHATAKAPQLAAIAIQTAGRGKKVEATEENLKKSEDLLQKQAEPIAASRPNHSAASSSIAVPAFLTAGKGTKIVASEESIKNVEQLLVGQSHAAASHTSGFQTAGNSTAIKPSSDALAKAESMLKYPVGRDSTDQSPQASVASETIERRAELGVFEETQQKSIMNGMGGCSGSDELTQQSHSPNLVKSSPGSADVPMAQENHNVASTHANSASPGACQSSDLSPNGHFQSKTPSNARLLPTSSLVTMSAGCRKKSGLDGLDSLHLKGLSLLDRLEMVNSQPLEPCDDLFSFVHKLAKEGKMTAKRGQCIRDGVLGMTIDVDSTNASNLRFSSNGLPESFSDDPKHSRGSIGFCNDVRNSLVDRGCNGDSISDAWICNHKRWIVWKLAATERKFSAVFGGLLMTYDNLVTVLCRRYNIEIKEGKRSAIRKILNKDLSASFMMILCVSNIFSHKLDGEKPATKTPAGESSNANSSIEFSLELSDDWYSVHAVADDRVCEAIRNGKIRIGTKLMVANATLVGNEDGIDPLDPKYTPEQKNCATFLRFSANASRLAKWDTRLGLVPASQQLQCEEGLFRVRKVSDIVPGGGFIPLIYLTVCRIYPLIYRHRHASGHDEWLSVSEENKQRLAFDKRKQKMTEAFIEQVEDECTKEVDENAPEVYKRLVKSGMGSESLTKEEQRDIDAWKSKRNGLLRSLIQREVEAKMEEDPSLERDSTPVVRVLVKSFDYRLSRSVQTATSRHEEAMLSIWQPTEEQMSLLQEGAVLQLKDLAVRNQKREGRIQLSANPRTKMGILPKALQKQHLSRAGYSERKFTPLFRLHVYSRNILVSPAESVARECDVAGVALKVVDQADAGPCNIHVYITDLSGLVVRVHCRDADLADGPLRGGGSRSHLCADEGALIVAFRDLRILPFDVIENCAVLEFQDRSAARVPRRSQKVEDLRQWVASNAGKAQLRRVSAFLEAGLHPMQRPQSDVATAVGYIRGCSPATSSKFRIVVDAGMPHFLELELPFHLMKHIKDTSESASPTKASAEAACSRFAMLGKDSRTRGTLYKFMLKRKPHVIKGANACEYEVVSFQHANVEAIAGVFLCYSAN